MEVSIIIPLAPGEDQWTALLEDVEALSGELEVILVVPAGTAPVDMPRSLPGRHVRLLAAPPGRGPQMNAGARSSRGESLWFLHADSRLTPDTLRRLQSAGRQHPDALFYCDLAFRDGNPGLMWLNSLGANLRSRWLKVPFGDQGFFIQRRLFEAIGGFPEGLPYGEDHVFVWRARQRCVDVRPVGAVIETSARKYEKHGWLRTTLGHQSLWLRQAWPEWKRLKGWGQG